MKIYLVGGAVRDKLLGLPVKERDWVVVGASVKDMTAKGYRQVGKEFPVFLHPRTNEEYALARTERKTGPGYKGFAFDSSSQVTLEDDLSRRDLTINAMAETEEGELIDPYHGKQDLDAHLLRHVSPAFAEDPVRILRIARFLARYASLGFKIAPETMGLMKQMVQSGEVNALVPERVWKELERALEEPNPELFFVTLQECGALTILFPGISIDSNGFKALIAAAKLTANHPHRGMIRFAALLHDLPNGKKAISTLCKDCRAPNAYTELGALTATHYATAMQINSANAQEILKLLNALDIYRREERFDDFIFACNAIAQVTKTKFDADHLLRLANVAKSVDVKLLIQQGLDGQALANGINHERLKKIEECINSTSKEN